ncbi:MAG TPA: hypothetical protein VLW88_13065 [Hyphomicrobium sp.]|jgi:hypothetical protein|nr:hypothetical protein [Hyphomicrobium sp.]
MNSAWEWHAVDAADERSIDGPAFRIDARARNPVTSSVSLCVPVNVLGVPAGAPPGVVRIVGSRTNFAEMIFSVNVPRRLHPLPRNEKRTPAPT